MIRQKIDNFLIYVASWTEADVLSQIVGSLIGAGIAVALWKAQASKEIQFRHEQFIEKRRIFRYVISSQTRMLLNDIDTIISNCNLYLSKLTNNPQDASGIISKIQSSAEFQPLILPDFLKIGERHVEFLAYNDIVRIDHIEVGFSKLNKGIRDWSAEDASAAIERLTVVTDVATELRGELAALLESSSG